jgi:hypothetical protein
VIGPQFDAVVVDEGQDFSEPWFEVLELLLRDQAEASSTSSTTTTRGSIPTDAIPTWLGEPYFLTRNVRNTNEIGAHVQRYYQGPPMRLSGVSGRKVTVLSYPDDAGGAVVVSRTKEALDHLRNDGAKPEDIVVLSGRRDGDVWQRRNYGEWRLYSADQQDGQVFYDTVHSFKGQDSAIVVLTELSASEADSEDVRDRAEALLYVGCSRAKAVLSLVVPASIAASLHEASTSEEQST